MVKPTPDPPESPLNGIDMDLKDLLSLALLQGLPANLPRIPHYLHALKRTLDRANQSLDLLEQRLPIVDAVVAEEPFIQEALDAVRGQLLLSHVLIDSTLNHCAGAPNP